MSCNVPNKLNIFVMILPTISKEIKGVGSKKYSVRDHKPTFWGPRPIPPQTGIDITPFFWPVKLSKSKLLQKRMFVPNLEEIGES